MIVLQCSMTNVCSVTSLNEIKIKWLQAVKSCKIMHWEIQTKFEM